MSENNREENNRRAKFESFKALHDNPGTFEAQPEY